MNNDSRMTIVKEKISDKMKMDCWRNNFKNKPFGICPYCGIQIIIPKCIKMKICPKINLEEYCFKNGLTDKIYGTHFDHLKSELNYGGTTLENLYPVCSVCNLQKGSKNHQEFMNLIKTIPNYLNSINSQIRYMEIDNKDGYCNGIVCDKNNHYKLCSNRTYFRGKCNNHLHQN